ncbi:hypothetical protein KBTX_04148 [wastewater metagenome]|uniref:Uncharacterized protein n=2 Tax=unclassified sequences TaxID=12908 RepID=A0A5B8RKL8_9ZZZZ|nr:hypothetical protein KBTEX_04148 [uncultured organism]
MVVTVVLAELHAPGAVGALEVDEIGEQVADEVHHEAQQRVAAGIGDAVVETELGEAQLALAVAFEAEALAQRDVLLERPEIRIREPPHGGRGGLDLDALAQLVDLPAVELLEVQVVAQRPGGLLDAGLGDIGAAGRAGAHHYQSLDLQRLERLAHRALGTAVEVDELPFLRQAIPRLQALDHDPALDVLDDQVGELASGRFAPGILHDLPDNSHLPGRAGTIYLFIRINSIDSGFVYSPPAVAGGPPGAQPAGGGGFGPFGRAGCQRWVPFGAG